MRVVRIMALLAVLISALPLSASLRDVQIYGIIERAVLEPNQKTPERIKLWGSFAALYTGMTPVESPNDSPYKPHRGYLYFKLPAGIAGQTIARREWADLVSIAGTGQPIMFGSWQSSFLGLLGNSREHTGFVSLSGKESLYVHSESEKADPITYTMDSGIVKLGSQHKVMTDQLKASLSHGSN